MNLSAPFVRRPIATTLLTIGIALAGIAAYFQLPISPLPQVDFPTISVQASLPGASPETMASSVATPLERRLGHIADVTEMTSSSGTGSTNITLQFSLNRNIDGAARDVQAAINAARIDLPATLHSNPTYRKVNPADAPVMILTLTSRSRTPGQIYDVASTIIQQQLSQVKGVGDVEIGGGSLPAVRVELNPLAVSRYGISMEDVRAALSSANANRPKGILADGPQRLQIYTNDQSLQAADYKPLIIAFRGGAAIRLQDVADVQDGVEDVHNLGLFACGPPPGTPYPKPGAGYGAGGAGRGGSSSRFGSGGQSGAGAPGGYSGGGGPGGWSGRRFGGGAPASSSAAGAGAAAPPASGSPAAGGPRHGGAHGPAGHGEVANSSSEAAVSPPANAAAEWAGAPGSGEPAAGEAAGGQDGAGPHHHFGPGGWPGRGAGAGASAPGAQAGSAPPWAGQHRHFGGGGPEGTGAPAGPGGMARAGQPGAGRTWGGPRGQGAPGQGGPGGPGGHHHFGQGGAPGGAGGFGPMPGYSPGAANGVTAAASFVPPSAAPAAATAQGKGKPAASSQTAACANTTAGARPSIVVIISRQPGANIIDTVERIKKALPVVEAALPLDINVGVAVDRTITIRSSLQDVERTLIIAILLVVLVVAFFLKSARATLVPAVAVTVSLLGAIGVMYLLGFSLDNLSLMALTVATGFVVDDAIVVLENISRHLEAGMPRYQAALLGAREVGFTVLSISISLIAVFIPILMMGGIVGRLFREFAITLSTAVMVSLLISLTTTPMICAYMLRPDGSSPNVAPGWWARASDGFFGGMRRTYERALDWALDNSAVALAILVCTIALNIYLWTIIPKGFFPTQDTGLLNGGMQADQQSSFQISQQRLTRFVNIIKGDPAVQAVVGYVNGGRGGGGGGFVFMSMKPKSQRQGGSDDLMARLRPQFNRVPGASMFLQPVQDVRVGGRQSNAAYQYTLEGPDLTTLRTWATKLAEAMTAEPDLADVNTDQQDHGLESFVNVNRDTEAQLGLNASEVDNTLYDAFGQRQVATIYKAQNQYHVIMEAAAPYIQDPTALANIYVSSTAAARAVATRLSAGGYTIPGYSPLGAAASTSATGGGGGGGASTLSTASNGSSDSSGQGSGGGGAASSSSSSGSSTSTTSSSASATVSANTTSTPLTFSAPSLASTSSGGGGGGGAASTGASGTSLIGASAPPSRGASSGLAISTSAETMVPLSSVATWADGSQPRSVNHQDESIATTISFNLAQGKSLSDAVTAVNDAEASIGMPPTVHGSFQGTAAVFQQSLANEPVLIGAALLAVYIVLGVLYESYIHPLTVISTLPSAGVGAVTALILFKTEFSIIALIGVILLIGIVKKNAIMIIDFALDAERSQGLSTRDAIRQASLLRFRPIMMTTFAAILGALPLAIGWGEGAELRRPLGIAIIGGLLVSQVLTLITTPVVYLYLDRFHKRSPEERQLGRSAAVGGPSAPPEPA